MSRPPQASSAAPHFEILQYFSLRFASTLILLANLMVPYRVFMGSSKEDTPDGADLPCPSTLTRMVDDVNVQ